MFVTKLKLGILITGVLLLAPRPTLADGPDGLAGNPPPPSDGMLYSVDTGTGNLVTINPNTAAINEVGPTGHTQIEGLTYHPPTDTLLAIEGNGDQLLSINRSTGAAEVVGPLSRDFIFGLTYSEQDDTLYAVDTQHNELLTINPATGAIDSLAAHSYDFVGGLTDDPVTGTLYGVDYGVDAVFSVLFFEGFGPGFSAPIVDLSPLGPQSLAYDSTTGDLFAIIADFGPDSLLRINRFNDTVGLVGLMESVTFASLEFVPNSTVVPEPGSICLAAMALTSGLAVRLRQRWG